ncbi:hypothetical protein C8A03DRAFT_41466 [Achaetomium macrosporum]|uniref:Uncharacterized protein n=1 Tax=Achaetomium macrosporum TaxID=79813 RepID=A0AAN7CFI6_9PEZI|nr:hypothetical protein C8A03DRAFT_41466 [Achaetomium macrosporum]
MSCAASPAAGGNFAANERSGTAHVATAAYPTPSPQDDFEIEVSDARAIDLIRSESQNNNGTPSNVSTGNSALPSSTSSGDFTGLADGAAPAADFNNSIVFGAELQRALFVNGEAAADPQLPASNTTSNPMANETQGTEAAPIAGEEDITVPVTPERPPATPPRLVNLPITGPPVAPPEFEVGGPANHNPLPPKPDTPLADQLRSDFMDRYGKYRQILHEYKLAYRAWAVFTSKADNKTKDDYDTEAEKLKTTAVNAQVAWVKYHHSFEKWKAENPAVKLIIDNIDEEMKAVSTAQRAKEERIQFIKDMQDKSKDEQRKMLSRLDNWQYLMKTARDREVYRGRVETQTKVQAMIEAQRQALIDEQNRIAAEEARKKAEAEAEERRKQAEAEAEAKRKKAEEERLKTDAEYAAKVQEEEEQRLMFETLLASMQEQTQQETGPDNCNNVQDPQTGSGNNFEQQFQGDFGSQFGFDAQYNEPLDFETLFAQQEAEMQAASQNGVDFTSQPGFDIDAPFPELPSFEDQIDQLLNARAQEFFSANVRVQAQLPSLHETMSANADSAVNQSQSIDDPIPAETPTGRKKAQPGKRKTAVKAKPGNGTASQSIQPQMPTQTQQQFAAQLEMTQMPVPSFGLEQVMASDPFVSTGPKQGTSNNGQGVFHTNLLSAAQMPSELANVPVQQTAQQLSSYSAFVNLGSNTPPQLSLSALMSSASAHASGQLTATPSSDNKRKASAAASMESPTKRRQSVNQQVAVVAVTQSTPQPPLPTGSLQILDTPVQNFQTPVNTAFHFGISPPSGGDMPFGTAMFGTAAKAGIVTVIRRLISEARRRGTILGQMLADGLQADFTDGQTGSRIKQVTKSCMVAVNATNPEDDNHAFNGGASKALLEIMQEMEHHGTVFGKGLLAGPLSGLFNEVAESYTSPPRFGGNSTQLAQPVIQATSASAPHAPTHVSQQPNVGNTSIPTGSPQVPGYPLLSASPVPSHAGVQQQNGHGSPATATQAHHRMPSNNSSSSMEGHPTSAAAMNGPAPPSYQELLQQLQQIQQQRDQQLQEIQQLKQQQTKKTPAPRKPRARKSSVAVSTPATDTAARNTPSPTQDSVTGSPGNAAPASNNNNTAGQSAPGQYVPRIAYHFSDRTFYMQKIGAGTVAAQTALRQFLSDAQAMGPLVVPPSFVLKLWLTMEQNLENLRRVLMGQSEVFF